MQKEKAKILIEIQEKIRNETRIIISLGYEATHVSAREFHDWMTGVIFSEDATTLQDVLDNEYLMVHELVEISELKKMGYKITKRVIVESPREAIYKAHFFAQDFEMNYALTKKDLSWVKERFEHHKRMLYDDPDLPIELRPTAQAIYDKYLKIIKETLQ